MARKKKPSALNKYKNKLITKPERRIWGKLSTLGLNLTYFETKKKPIMATKNSVNTEVIAAAL